MATAAQSDVQVPASEILATTEGRPVLFYENGDAVAALISMEDYEIVRLAKVQRMLDAFDVMAREVEAMEASMTRPLPN